MEQTSLRARICTANEDSLNLRSYNDDWSLFPSILISVNGRGFTVSADLNSERGYRHYSIGKHLQENRTDVRGGGEQEKRNSGEKTECIQE